MAQDHNSPEHLPAMTPASMGAERPLAEQGGLARQHRRNAILATGILGGGGGFLGFLSFSVAVLVVETVVLPPFGTPGGA